MSCAEICDKFYEAFQERNLEIINDLIDDNIELMDWDVKVKGRENFLNVHKKIFNKIDDIKIIIKYRAIQKNHQSSNVFNEIEIRINNNTEKLNVVDIFEIASKTNIITSVRAFKR